MSRRTKTEKYLARAKTASEDSTCLRRRYGAVIVKNDAVIAEGYNGSPRKQPNCTDLGFCERDRLGVPKGERYELCVAVHAEQNAIIQASRNDMIGATLYIYGEEVATGKLANPAPCLICSRMIVNAGIKEVIGPNGYYWKVPLEGEEVIPIGEYKKDAVCTCGKPHADENRGDSGSKSGGESESESGGASGGAGMKTIKLLLNMTETQENEDEN